MKGPFPHAITTSLTAGGKAVGIRSIAWPLPVHSPKWIKRPREWGGSASAGQPPALEMNDQLL